MKPETKEEYIKLAIHFEKTVHEKLGVERAAPSDYIKELILRAEHTTPAYWRRLRNALKVRCAEQGFSKYEKKYAELKNPLTAAGVKTDGMKKRTKLKHVSESDFNKLHEKADPVVKAYLDVVSLTGCRPAEVLNIALGDGTALIESVKKDEKNSRGLDREVRFKNDADFEKLTRALGVIRDESKDKDSDKFLGAIQVRFDRLAKRVFPKKKGLCLYTFRHQYGANLKASGVSRKEAAYIMGHRVTKSLNEYGDRRWGKSVVAVEAAQSFDGIKENHNTITNENRNEIMKERSHTKSSFDYSR